MAYFAQLDENNVVLQVIAVNDKECLDENGIEQEHLGIKFCESLVPGKWIQTSFSGRIRKQFAGIGFTYDPERDAFIQPKPYPSWILEEESLGWNSPVPMPEPIEGMIWVWNESEVNWKSIKGMEI